MSLIYTPDPPTLPQGDLGIPFTNVITIQDGTSVPPVPPETEPTTTFTNITSCTVVPKVNGFPYYEDTVNISITGIGTTTVTITISGYYIDLFDQSYWQYQITNPSAITTSKYTEIPEHIFGLTHYHPDPRTLIFVYYHVTANGQTVVFDKAIRNNWDIGRDLIAGVNARGEVI